MNVVQVGDGTTTVVLLAAEFLREAKPFIEDGVHPQNLIRSYRTAGHLVLSQNYISFHLLLAFDIRTKFRTLHLINHAVLGN